MDEVIEPLLKCEVCGYIGCWYDKSVGEGIWITCRCGHIQELLTSKQEDEILRHKEE